MSCIALSSPRADSRVGRLLGAAAAPPPRRRPPRRLTPPRPSKTAAPAPAADAALGRSWPGSSSSATLAGKRLRRVRSGPQRARPGRPGGRERGRRRRLHRAMLGTTISRHGTEPVPGAPTGGPTPRPRMPLLQPRKFLAGLRQALQRGAVGHDLTSRSPHGSATARRDIARTRTDPSPLGHRARQARVRGHVHQPGDPRRHRRRGRRPRSRAAGDMAHIGAGPAPQTAPKFLAIDVWAESTNIASFSRQRPAPGRVRQALSPGRRRSGLCRVDELIPAGLGEFHEARPPQQLGHAPERA